MNQAFQILLEAHLPAGMAGEVVLSPRSRRLRLALAGQRLQLRLPSRARLNEVDRFLGDSRDWIARQRIRVERLQDQLTADLRLQLPQGWLPLWGERREWHCRPGPARVDLAAHPIQVGLDPAHQQADQRLRRLLRAALSRLLHQRATACIARLRPQLTQAPGRLRIRSMRSLWGSLSPRGDISLNLGLVFLQPALADYVVAHELAHLSQRNHSPAFWREVARLEPAWRPARAALREQHERVQALLAALG